MYGTYLFISDLSIVNVVDDGDCYIESDFW